MNKDLAKERNRLYQKKKNMREMNFMIKDKSASTRHYDLLYKVENKHEFYDKFIKALVKSENN